MDAADQPVPGPGLGHGLHRAQRGRQPQAGAPTVRGPPPAPSALTETCSCSLCVLKDTRTSFSSWFKTNIFSTYNVLFKLILHLFCVDFIFFKVGT